MTTKKTVLEPIDGARSRLTGEGAVEVEARKPAPKSAKGKPEPVDTDLEAAVEAFSEPIGSAIDRGEATVAENCATIIDRVERLKSNYVEWSNLSHVQRSMITGALCALKEVTGEKEHGIPVSLSRFLGVTLK
jgi:hypothetical protein